MPADLRVDFLSVGPSRTASSWLDEALRASPDLFLPAGVKETMFFDQRYDQGLDWYAWHFRDARADQKCGEVGSSYFLSPEARERVERHSPSARIIVHLRDPVGRAVSMFMHHLRRGRVPADLRQAVTVRPDILDGSRTHLHLPEWQRRFSTLVIPFDRIATEPAGVLREITDFLEVAPYQPPDIAEKKNVEQGVPRYPRVAKTVSRVATGLRKLRLHRVSEVGKRLGLKRLYTSNRGPEKADLVTDDDRAFLARELQDATAFHREILGTLGQA